jgi:lactate dehydrogenase-like 2-hydroxyacid dehydrogenase
MNRRMYAEVVSPLSGVPNLDNLQITGPFNAEVVRKLPKSLRYICHNGAGYDNIDIAECSSRGQSPL